MSFARIILIKQQRLAKGEIALRLALEAARKAGWIPLSSDDSGIEGTQSEQPAEPVLGRDHPIWSRK